MSITPEEAAYDEYMSLLYEEHKKKAIEEFTDERFRSYYLDHNLLAKPAFDALTEARNLIGTNATAGFIFSAIAMEVGLKEMLLKPIVFGLVHADSVASLITDLAVSHSGMDRYRKLLLQVLRERGGVDLDSFKRPNSNKPIWQEITEVQKQRNSILHRAKTASNQEAALALGVALALIETMFPTVVTKIGLHLHEGLRICDDWKCKYEGISLKKINDGI